MLFAIIFVVVAPKKWKKKSGGAGRKVTEFYIFECKKTSTMDQERALMMFLNWKGVLEVGSVCRGRMSVVG